MFTKILLEYMELNEGGGGGGGELLKEGVKKFEGGKKK